MEFVCYFNEVAEAFNTNSAAWCGQSGEYENITAFGLGAVNTTDQIKFGMVAVDKEFMETHKVCPKLTFATRMMPENS